ncbi:MAG: hypothetical protein ACR2JM_04305 [Mycobacterium sp.]
MDADAVVLTRMTAAAEVMRAAGFEVDSGADADAHLSQAVRWQRYSRAAPSSLHRRCALDLARGSMRLWAQAGGQPRRGHRTGRRPGRSPRQALALVRVHLCLQTRSRCAALRVQVTAETAEASRRRIGSIEARFHDEAARMAADLDDTLARRLAGIAADAGVSPQDLRGAPDGPEAVTLPRTRPQHRSRLENRLTALLGTGFGLGVSLTAGRLVADLSGGWTAPAAGGAGAVGLGLTAWVVRTRLLLAERAGLERRLTVAIADLRAGLEERVVIRVLAAEAALAAAVATADPGEPVSDRSRPPVGHTPN